MPLCGWCWAIAWKTDWTGMNANTESTANNAAGQVPAGESGGGYHFNDPRFVNWWLDSLYLLPIDDQVAVAERLRERVGILEVQAVIDVFVDDRIGGSTFVGPAAGTTWAPEKPAEFGTLPVEGVALATIRRMWTERRPLLIFLGLILSVYAMRGLLFLFDSAKALLFG